MTKLTLVVERRKLRELQPFEGNSKQHPPSQIDAMAKSIRRFGFNDPIAIRSDGTLVEGHGRVMAANQLRMTEVPCIVLPDSMSDRDVDLYRIAHNKIALSSGFDFKRLAEELHSLQGEGITYDLIGFSDEAVRALMSIFDPDGGQPVHPGGDLNYDLVWPNKDDAAAWALFLKGVTEARPDLTTGAAVIEHIQRAGIFDGSAGLTGEAKSVHQRN